MWNIFLQKKIPRVKKIPHSESEILIQNVTFLVCIKKKVVAEGLHFNICNTFQWKIKKSSEKFIYNYRVHAIQFNFFNSNCQFFCHTQNCNRINLIATTIESHTNNEYKIIMCRIFGVQHDSINRYARADDAPVYISHATRSNDKSMERGNEEQKHVHMNAYIGNLYWFHILFCTMMYNSPRAHIDTPKSYHIPSTDT